VFSAGFTYSLPTSSGSLWRDGWQFNAIATLQTGTPFNITTGTDNSGTGDRQDRPDLVGDPFADVVQPTSGTAVRWFNPAAFAVPARGTYGNLARNQFYGPSLRTVDISVFKTTKVSGRTSVQLRCEVFNLFNTNNWSNPGTNLSSSTSLGLMTNTRNGSGAPGIGAGEPRNVQLAAKILF
jgi:hypothetical protein